MKTPVHTCKIAVTMKYSLFIQFIALALLLSGCIQSRSTEPIADDSFFISRNHSAAAAEEEPYQCVRLRRGDIIELDGEVLAEDSPSGKIIVLKTAAGRSFILDKINAAAAGSLLNKKIHVKGKVLFEGNNEQLPILSVIEAK